MDSIHLSESTAVVTGLIRLMDDLIGAGDYVTTWSELPYVTMLVEVAKRADDTTEYFPRGKWATIQSLQERIAATIDEEIAKTRTQKGQVAR